MWEAMDMEAVGEKVRERGRNEDGDNVWSEKVGR